MGFLSDVVEAFVPSTIENLYTEDLPQATAPDVSFKPFTVSGPTGSVSAGPTGTTYTLGGAGQQLQSALESSALSRFNTTPAGVGQLGTAAGQAMGVGGQFMGQIGMPMGAREQEVYDRIRATQLGEEERQRLALEERLFSQGRGGVRTAMFGGTPEQLALAQAQEEAQNRASLAAIQQAQAEQQQQAAIGSQFTGLGAGLTAQQQALEAGQQQMGLGALQGAYIPQAAMLSAFSPALSVASLEDVARRQGGELALESQMANISGLVGQRAALANLYGNIYGGLGSGLGGLLGGGEGSLLDLVFGD
jgi:hypothetical protein